MKSVVKRIRSRSPFRRRRGAKELIDDIKRKEAEMNRVNELAFQGENDPIDQESTDIEITLETNHSEQPQNTPARGRQLRRSEQPQNTPARGRELRREPVPELAPSSSISTEASPTKLSPLRFQKARSIRERLKNIRKEQPSEKRVQPKGSPLRFPSLLKHKPSRIEFEGDGVTHVSEVTTPTTFRPVATKGNVPITDVQEAIKEMERRLERLSQEGQRVSRATVLETLFDVADSFTYDRVRSSGLHDETDDDFAGNGNPFNQDSDPFPLVRSMSDPARRGQPIHVAPVLSHEDDISQTKINTKNFRGTHFSDASEASESSDSEESDSGSSHSESSSSGTESDSEDESKFTGASLITEQSKAYPPPSGILSSIGQFFGIPEEDTGAVHQVLDDLLWTEFVSARQVCGLDKGGNEGRTDDAESYNRLDSFRGKSLDWESDMDGTTSGSESESVAKRRRRRFKKSRSWWRRRVREDAASPGPSNSNEKTTEREMARNKSRRRGFSRPREGRKGASRRLKNAGQKEEDPPQADTSAIAGLPQQYEDAVRAVQMSKARNPIRWENMEGEAARASPDHYEEVYQDGGRFVRSKSWMAPKSQITVITRDATPHDFAHQRYGDPDPSRNTSEQRHPTRERGIHDSDLDSEYSELFDRYVPSPLGSTAGYPFYPRESTTSQHLPRDIYARPVLRNDS